MSESAGCSCLGKNEWDDFWGWSVWRILVVDPFCEYHADTDDS